MVVVVFPYTWECFCPAVTEIGQVYIVCFTKCIFYYPQPLGMKVRKINSCNLILETKFSYLMRLNFMVKAPSDHVD